MLLRCFFGFHKHISRESATFIFSTRNKDYMVVYWKCMACGKEGIDYVAV